MDAGVGVVLVAMGGVALIAIVSFAVGWRRIRQERAQTREAQADLSTRSHPRTPVAAAATATLAGLTGQVGQPQGAVAAGAPPDPTATATQDGDGS